MIVITVQISCAIILLSILWSKHLTGHIKKTKKMKCRSKLLEWNIGTKLIGKHNISTTLLEVELESACLSGQVRPPLYSFDSTQPLSCLSSSVVRASAYIASSVSWVRIPPEQLFFLFGEKRVVWVSCLALFSIYRS